MFAEAADIDDIGAGAGFVSIPMMLKASPVEDGGKRFLYLEVSNESIDLQGEVVLKKALAESSEYYLQHGNIDINHFTQRGPALGIKDHLEYEIGRPVEVKIGDSLMVKGELYQGSSAMARHANTVWDSLTKQKPPMRWYPSVGGGVLAKSTRIDPNSGDKVTMIERVRWNNVALDRCPVNTAVPEASATPIGTFSKSLGGFILNKALEAGYGTDSATLEGGGSLREQSLDRARNGDGVFSYFDFRNRMADAVRGGKAGTNPSAPNLVTFAKVEFGLSDSAASEHVERFLADLHAGLTRKKQEA